MFYGFSYVKISDLQCFLSQFDEIPQTIDCFDKQVGKKTHTVIMRMTDIRFAHLLPVKRMDRHSPQVT